jgi:hypothetical protein
MKSLSQDILSPGRDFNPGSPEYEAGVPTIRPLRLVNVCTEIKSLFFMVQVTKEYFRKGILAKHVCSFYGRNFINRN